MTCDYCGRPLDPTTCQYRFCSHTCSNRYRGEAKVIDYTAAHGHRWSVQWGEERYWQCTRCGDTLEKNVATEAFLYDCSAQDEEAA